MSSSRVPAFADVDSTAFWEALGEHRLVLQRCGANGHVRFPPMPACPVCADTEFDTVAVDGGGVVYSRVRVHRALSPAMANETPYTVAAVDLDAGPRVFARVEPDAAIGDRVQPTFVDHADWTELRFRPELDQSTGDQS
jgi:uncharacterized OB-fold protein